MIDFTHSCAASLRLDTPAMAHSEFEGSFLLPQLMGALASESIAVAATRPCEVYPQKPSALKSGVALLRALKLRFSTL